MTGRTVDIPLLYLGNLGKNCYVKMSKNRWQCNVFLFLSEQPVSVFKVHVGRFCKATTLLRISRFLSGHHVYYQQIC